jgi:hypothetical protein
LNRSTGAVHREDIRIHSTLVKASPAMRDPLGEKNGPPS